MEGFICIQTFLSTLFKFSGDIEPDDIRVSYLQFEAITIIMSSMFYNAKGIKPSVIIIITSSSLMNLFVCFFMWWAGVSSLTESLPGLVHQEGRSFLESEL